MLARFLSGILVVCALAVAVTAAPSPARAVLISFDVTTPVHGSGTVLIDPLDPLVVDVRVSGLGSGGDPSVAAYDLTVTFGPSQLTLGSVVFGTGLGTPFSQTTDTSTAGQVHVSETSFEPASFFLGQATSFTLFTLTFTADQIGLTSLDFLNSPPSNPILVSDVAGSPLAVTTASQAVRVVPEPTLGILLLCGLVAGARRRATG